MIKRNKIKNNKAAQVEIMGLVIIVIIISLVLLFVVKVVFSPGSSTEFSSAHKDLTSTFVNTLLQTDSGCTSDTTIQDLFVNCARSPGKGSITCYDGTKSCEYLNTTTIDIMQKTLDKWRLGEARGYEFVAVVPPQKVIMHYTSGNLSSSMGGEVEPFPLSLYPSPQDLMIYLCVGGCGISY